MHSVYFAGKCLDEFKAFVTNAGVYSTPVHGYDSFAVAGRNGNLTMEKNRYENVEHRYPIVITEDFDKNYSALRAYLLSKRGYNRLADTFNSDEYYLANFAKFEAVKQKFIDGTMGTCVLVFDRKPQRYLKSGEEVMSFTAGGSFINPTKFDALPLIRVTGNGTLTINGVSIVISTTESYLDIDCELQEVLQAGGNLDITLTNGEFPKLISGTNTFTMSGITSIDITPRWWTL